MRFLPIAIACAAAAARAAPAPALAPIQGAPIQGAPIQAASEPRAAEAPPDWSALRARLDAAKALQNPAEAKRAAAALAVDALASFAAHEDATALPLLGDVAAYANKLGALVPARDLRRSIVAFLERTVPADHPDLLQARFRLAGSLGALGDHDGAQALYVAVEEARERTLPPDHRDLIAVRQNKALNLREKGDLAGARAIQERVLESAARTFDADSREMQSVRLNLGSTLEMQGESARARDLFAGVVAVYERTLPADDPDLLLARGNLAVSLRNLGDVRGAVALLEANLASRLRTLPADHEEVQRLRMNLAVALTDLGDVARTRALEQEVLDAYSRTLPDDHPELQRARRNLGSTLVDDGQIAAGRALQEKVLEVYARTLPRDNPEYVSTRGAYAITLVRAGDLRGARAIQEEVLATLARSLPEEHPRVLRARHNLAATLRKFGDLRAARAIQEGVLAIYERTLTPDDPALAQARLNLAITLDSLGDAQACRQLEERVLEAFSRTRPDDHPELQTARANLAATLVAIGDASGGRKLWEKVLAVRESALPADDPDLQRARLGLASVLRAQGEIESAHALQVSALDALTRTLPAGDARRLSALQDLAITEKRRGNPSRALELEEEVLSRRKLALEDDAPGSEAIRRNLARTLALVAERADDSPEGRAQVAALRTRAVEVLTEVAQARIAAAERTLVESAPREAQARCEEWARGVDVLMAFGAGAGVFAPCPELDELAFQLIEVTRGAAIGAATFLRASRNAPGSDELRQSLRDQSDALARLARKGTTSAEFQAAVARREALQRDLIRLAEPVDGGTPGRKRLDARALARELGPGTVAIAFRRYGRWAGLDEEPGPVASLCAFVVRGAAESAEGSPAIARVELGPVAPLRAAVESWRAACGVAVGDGRAPPASAGAGASGRGLASNVGEDAEAARDRGFELRRLVLDPLLPRLEGVERIVYVPDSALELVPLDALPLDAPPIGSDAAGDAPQLVGDRWRVSVRRTLTELVAGERDLPAAGEFVALGGADFGVEPLSLSVPDDPAGAPPARIDGAQAAAILRGGAFEHGFTALPQTSLEVRAIAALYPGASAGGSAAHLVEGRRASRTALGELAPRARWLHVATHGWFAPASVRSWADAEPLDARSGLAFRAAGVDQVRGMSPMLLCGLALAGANLPEDAAGVAPGLVTADELSALDLSGCEMAVLSACETNVGEARVGQGVASMQLALQMAGARSVVTSLWRVPDEATKVLMLDFYRRVWVEKQPKARALWEAKRRLRRAVDADGRPMYSLRDWAAWVLTGAAD